MRVAVWLALLTLSGGVIAPAQEISYDYDQSADFNAFRTYAWVRGTELDDELNHKRIVDALDAGLAAEGLSKVEATADPDLLVAYHARFGRDLEIQGFSSGWGPYRFGANRYGSARVDEILVGTLVVDMVDAETAFRIGLGNRLWPHDEIRERVWAFARQLAKGPPLVHRLVKQAVYASQESTLDEALDREARGQVQCLQSRDFLEGVAAFLSKRDPNFSGS